MPVHPCISKTWHPRWAYLRRAGEFEPFPKGHRRRESSGTRCIAERSAGEPGILCFTCHRDPRIGWMSYGTRRRLKECLRASDDRLGVHAELLFAQYLRT